MLGILLKGDSDPRLQHLHRDRHAARTGAIV
jgi:hypothetical protein